MYRGDLQGRTLCRRLSLWHRFGLFVLLFLLLFVKGSIAQQDKGFITKIIEETYHGSEEESKVEVLGKAKARAERRSVEEIIGIYLESHTTVEDYRVTRDEIKTWTQGHLKIEVLDEKYRYEKGGHGYVKLKVSISRAETDQFVKEREELHSQKIESDKTIMALEDSLKKQRIRLEHRLAQRQIEEKYRKEAELVEYDREMERLKKEIERLGLESEKKRQEVKTIEEKLRHPEILTKKSPSRWWMWALGIGAVGGGTAAYFSMQSKGEETKPATNGTEGPGREGVIGIDIPWPKE